MDEAKLINLFPKPLVLMENIFTDKLDFLEGFLKQQKGFKRNIFFKTTTKSLALFMKAVYEGSL